VYEIRVCNSTKNAIFFIHSHTNILVMKPRLYFDTSVFGGVYDEEFEEISTLLFEKVRLGQIICVYSDLSVTELKNAPKKIINHFE